MEHTSASSISSSIFRSAGSQGGYFIAFFGRLLAHVLLCPYSCESTSKLKKRRKRKKSVDSGRCHRGVLYLVPVMSSGSTEGIRQLLAAEKRAAEVVKQARNRSVRRTPRPRALCFSPALECWWSISLTM